MVRERLEPFLAAARERSASGRGLPAHVERDLRAYLDCGILARGFARVRCPDCGFERLVGFSCKAHSCPSCNARKMEDAAVRLVRDVFPAVPVRQWVLSFPRRLRFLAARDPRVVSRLLQVFTRAIFAWQRRRARQAGAADPRTGGSSAVQRFGSALNLNVHFHTLVPDGVFDLSEEGPARFVPLKPPTDEEVGQVLERVIRRVARLGLPEEAGGAEGEEDAFAALQAAEVDRRLRFPDPFRRARRSAALDGFSLHAGVRVHANDRQGLERLCRYAVRPPLALHRLSAGPDGRLVYRMKRPRKGSLLLVLAPDELLGRLATLVPPPRSHALRYHGVFAPNARDRARVVPRIAAEDRPPAAAERERPEERTNSKEEPFRLAVQEQPAPPGPRDRLPWAELLKRVFEVDVLACPRCDGRLEVIAFIAEEKVARRILEHLGRRRPRPWRGPSRPARARPRTSPARTTAPTRSTTSEPAAGDGRQGRGLPDACAAGTLRPHTRRARLLVRAGRASESNQPSEVALRYTIGR